MIPPFLGKIKNSSHPHKRTKRVLFAVPPFYPQKKLQALHCVNDREIYRLFLTISSGILLQGYLQTLFLKACTNRFLSFEK